MSNILLILTGCTSKKESCPATAMQAIRGRRNTAPTHSYPLNGMGVSGQRNAPAAFYPREKDTRYLLGGRLGGPQSWCGQRSNPGHPVAQSIVRHYTD
jgi:hypothetical protein